MKREFKFRGKDSRTGEWLYGDLVHSADKKRRAILVSDRDCYDECEVQFDSIAQFTGFLDYHKEIYEGDILMLAGYICVVEWNSDVCAFCIRFIFEKKVGSKPLGSWLEECREWEVIGNIIDNPEFLNDANADLNTPNSGELKIQTIENVPFHAADRVKVIDSSTEAVLSGRKTQTRRIVPQKELDKACEFAIAYFNETFDVFADDKDVLQHYFLVEEIGKLPYRVGEIVAIAQRYKDIGLAAEAPLMEANGIGGYVKTELSPGWTNKMFVRADLMPRQIRITNVRVERLQDISDEDCIAEGIDYVNGYSESYFFGFGVKSDKGWIRLGNTPREAYAALINRISGKGTWQSNPYVLVDEFELEK